MKVQPYLVVRKSPRRYEPSYRIVKSKPALDADEIAIRLSLDLPDALFEKPMLEASITIDPDNVSRPVIAAETIHNVEEMIQQGTGFSVKLMVIEPEEENEV